MNYGERAWEGRLQLTMHLKHALGIQYVNLDQLEMLQVTTSGTLYKFGSYKFLSKETSPGHYKFTPV